MPLAKKQREERPEFKEVRGGLAERFVDRFREHPSCPIVTSFGCNYLAMQEFSRRLEEFKDCGEMIVVNEVGLGIEERSKQRIFVWGMMGNGIVDKIGIAGERIKKENVSLEPFELLNKIRNSGIRPEEFVLYAMDLRKDVLLAVKSTKVLKIRENEEMKKYLNEFFPQFQREKRGFRVVEIPKEYRKRIVCPAPLNIEECAAPVKGHLTFSFIYGGSLKSGENYLRNLAKSTRSGGYAICFENAKDEVLEKVGLRRVQSGTPWAQVYRVE